MKMTLNQSIGEFESETIEKQFQKKTQLEHILLRPDSYVGSIKKEEKLLWVFDSEKEAMVEKMITYNPALYKIFDEILVNASDNKIRDKNMTAIRVDIDSKKNMIRIWNNGQGIPVVMHKEHNVYVPTLIFGQLLTSSNFNDDEKKVTGGRNGYGAKLCNIFSNEFILETSNRQSKKRFQQTWTRNMTEFTDPVIGDAAKEDYTCVTFYPDLKRFGMNKLDEDIVSLFSRRAYDIAACTKGITVFLNNKQLNVKHFKDYVELYTKTCFDENEEPLKISYETYGDRWEIAVTTSVKEAFTQVSFVNSIATTKGGTHVNYVADQVAAKILEIAKKKIKDDKQAVKLKTAQVKMNMWIFVRCLIENPSFDSQTKENMTLNAKEFGSECKVSDKFINQVAKCGIVEQLTRWTMFKNQALLDKKCSKTKQSKLKDIPKLDDANLAGGKKSLECTLILTEGDSAKTLAVSGLAVIGRDHFGIFPLRGKLLNVREATTKQLSENAEITNLVKILGLQYSQKYETADSLKTLRYGKVMIMTDQDQDGSHIKGLLINFIHSKWPNLLKHNFIEQFITPIVKVFKGNQVLSFYSMPEFYEWQRNTVDSNKWNHKYYKGLGTSTSKEAKEYFSDMVRHLIKFRYDGENDGKSIVLAFSKTKADDRKEWLTSWMEECKRRRELGLDDIYLYGKGTKYITYDNFVNQELILFSNTDNERSIPNMMDGFKPGQRKVLFACMKRNLVKELKVAQLAGSVAELSAYHHGEASLMSTIINLAQDYVGSNNINLLMPNGQFGTRLVGGKDSASPRYICTQLNKITKLIFRPEDANILKYLNEDGSSIEPEWYVPIIPMILVNGCDGIGTGWSSKIPNFNPKDVINNIKRLINRQTPLKMHPWFRGFRGTITEVCENKYQVSGEIGLLGDNCLEITELPVRTWTSTYKENVMEIYRHGSDKCPSLITDYKEYNTDKTVRFVVEMNPAKYAEAETMGFHKFFKLQSQLTLSNLILFDECGVIRKYNTVADILSNFYKVRLDMYHKRKDFMLGQLAAEASKLQNQARFILEKIEGKIIVENKKLKSLIETLKKANYDSDPIKAWKNTMNLLSENITESKDEDENEDNGNSNGPDFSYLYTMQIFSLTEEKKDKLLKERDAKLRELEKVKNTTPEEMWIEELVGLENALEEFEKELIESDSTSKMSVEIKKKGKQVKLAEETRPSPFARRVEVKIDDDILKKVVADEEKKKKEKANKKEKQIMKDYFTPRESGDNEQMLKVNKDLENSEDEPLLVRLAAKGNANLLAMKKKPGVTKIAKKPIQRKRKEREPWQSDVETLSSEDDDSFYDSNDSCKENKSDNSPLMQPDKNIDLTNCADTSKNKQSAITDFLSNNDLSKAIKSKNVKSIDNDAPPRKKSKFDKVKSSESDEIKKTSVPKLNKKPSILKRTVVSNEKKNLDLLDDEGALAKNRLKRKAAPKNFEILSDGDNNESYKNADIDFDSDEIHQETVTKKKNVHCKNDAHFSQLHKRGNEISDSPVMYCTQNVDIEKDCSRQKQPAITDFIKTHSSQNDKKKKVKLLEINEPATKKSKVGKINDVKQKLDRKHFELKETDEPPVVSKINKKPAISSKAHIEKSDDDEIVVFKGKRKVPVKNYIELSDNDKSYKDDDSDFDINDKMKAKGNKKKIFEDSE